MGDPRHELGLRAELAVANWLSAQGWLILDRRWRCPSGEIDVVGVDRAGTLVAVEVKLRSTGRAGTGAESVSAARVARLRTSLGRYAATGSTRGRELRVDLVEVAPLHGERWHLRHLPGIGAW